MYQIRKESDWKYSTSTSNSISAGPVAAAMSVITLTRPNGGDVNFNYLSLGVGAGVGLKVNAAAATQDSYSTGKIWILDSFSGAELDNRDIEGFCLIQEVSIGVGLGASGTAMLLGIPWQKMPLELLKKMSIDFGLGGVIEPPETRSILYWLLVDLGWFLGGPVGAYLGYKAAPKLVDILQTSGKALLLMAGFNSGPQITLGATKSWGYVFTGDKPEWAIGIEFPPEPLIPISPYRNSSFDDSIIRLPSNLLFDFDCADIRLEAYAELRSIAEIIRRKGPKKVSVEGHTDAIGTNEYNRTLSVRRANAVAHWLRKRIDMDSHWGNLNYGQRINRIEISALGWGESRPIASNASKDTRQLNRRVEIILVP